MSDDAPQSNKPVKKPASEELLKLNANYLHGNIREELDNDADHVTSDTGKLLKFHGMYQQDDRDKRFQGEKVYSLMIRGRIPGGRLTAAQYLVWDDIASTYANDTLRLTTRQSIQLHGVLKRNVRKTIQTIHTALLSTTGACGDVVRNVTQAVNPLGDPALSQLDIVSERLSDHFKARSSAYAEIFLDDEPVFTPSPVAIGDDRSRMDTGEGKDYTIEPLYGQTYLPRKFKIGVTLAGNNSIDLYTNDMGFAATLDPKGRIDGFFVFAGGGLGMTHNKPTTFPRVADLLGWVPEHALMSVAEAVVTAYRDHGDRTDRKHARLKYVLADMGVDWFRAEVEKRADIRFEQRELPAWKTPGYLGWHQHQDGTWALGVHILSGRIANHRGVPLKSALREIIGGYGLNVQITPDQDLILTGIAEKDREAVGERFFALLGDDPFTPLPVYEKALACPALPTCGLAITEAERYLPNLLPQIQEILAELALNDRAPVIRMTGCPNGCARPYSAELGLVGRTVGAYAVYVGGDREGTRIGHLLNDNVKAEVFGELFRELFMLWKKESLADERFGDFTHRYSLEKLQAAMMSLV